MNNNSLDASKSMRMKRVRYVSDSYRSNTSNVIPFPTRKNEKDIEKDIEKEMIAICKKEVQFLDW